LASRVSGRTVRRLLPVFVTLLILFEIAAYASTVTRPQEQFMQLYALGATGTAANYYPNNSTLIKIGENVQWSLGVVNNMGSLQYVSLEVKLGNLTINSPNDTLATPSPAPLFAEFNRFIPDNGTWQVPFTWQIANYTTGANGTATIREITINGATYSIQDAPVCQSANSCSLRMIFELWTWNVDTANFQFGWVAGNQRHIAWLQLWFNLSPTISPR